MPFQKGHKINVGRSWPSHVGFQKGHGAFPGNPGNRGMRGRWTRPDNKERGAGFQPGHPSFYTGGSVIGHWPTNGSIKKRMAGGNKKSRSKEREIMEALQNGKDPSALQKRYPPLQVERLSVLHDVATDVTHRDFIKAQVLVREILVRSKDGSDEAGGSGGGEIVLLHGTAGNVPLPGSGDQPAPADSGE